MSQLKAALQALAAQAKANNIHRMAEMQVQSSYVIKTLELLGWKDSDMKMGAAQGTNTGNFPDIRLHDRNKHTVLVVECKDARRADKLDGRYANKTFVEQLYGYCRAEGINWGILTNFVEWRLYNDVQNRLYENKKYAFLDLLWPGANPKSYVDILSDEGLAFLMKFQRTPLCQTKGKVDYEPLYYPVEKQVEDIKAKFFIKLKGWRDSLRRELHKNYWEKYEKDQIDLFTQKILDRMIFIEVCHDKDIIGQDVHRAILSSRDDKYHELKKWFKEMDEQFNTELFAPMAIDHFDIDDKVLVPIIEELNEIDFKNVSVHIIGEVYENYLGEMLRVTKKSGLKVQEHKEQAKRKSQGIYYTPEYIVDYIVKNTVGELVKKARTEEDLKKIKILDPACGSGSFLIKAFDVMYEAYEKLKIEKNKGQLETGKDLKIKRAILQHNLYGVDLDDRAVEITKLNLMLKALEGFNYHELKGRKLLPSLNLNIRVGNSLISGQTIEQLAEKQTAPTFPGLDDTININPLLKLHNAFYKEVEDEEKARLIKEIEVEERRLNRKLGDNLKGYFSNLDEIKPLNYQVAFPEVYKQGGFDAVIGNPPWIQSKFMDLMVKKYYEYRYNTARKQYDIFNCFIEKANEIMMDNGKFGFIIPSRWIMNTDYIALRKYLTHKVSINEIVDVGENIFEEVEMPSLLLFYDKSSNEKSNINNTFKIKYDIEDKISIYKTNKLLQGNIAKDAQYLFSITQDVKLTNIFAKIEGVSSKFGDFVTNARGVEIGKKSSVVFTEKKDDYVKFLVGEDIGRYYTDSCHYLKLGTKGIDYKQPELYQGNKIIIRKTGTGINATLDRDNYVIQVIYIFRNKQEKYDLNYYLGILNSKLMSKYYFVKYGEEKKKAFPHLRQTTVLQLPICNIDFKNKKYKTLHDQLVKLVKEMLKLNKTPELRQRHAADIAVIDKEIDDLVYRLYGLSEAEKKVVEG